MDSTFKMGKSHFSRLLCNGRFVARRTRFTHYPGLFSTNDATSFNHHAAPMRDGSLKALNIDDPMH